MIRKAESYSSLSSFLSCRKKYWFRYVEGLVPVVRDSALSFGSGVHVALENIFKSCPSTTPLRVHGLSFDRQEVRKLIETAYTADELASAGTETLVAAIAVEHMFKNMPTGDWRLVCAEMPFELEVPNTDTKLRGVFDGIVDMYGSLYIIEHKTIAGGVTEKRLNHLLIDNQASIYTAAAKAVGYDVSGVIYNFIPKPTIERHLATPMEKRKYKQDGTLYANQRSEDECDDAYIARVDEWYQKNELSFVQHLVVRNAAENASAIGMAESVIGDIHHAASTSRYYRNPDACKMFGCPYFSVCVEDTKELREANFSIGSVG